jgi:hypothetical protein
MNGLSSVYVNALHEVLESNPVKYFVAPQPLVSTLFFGLLPRVYNRNKADNYANSRQNVRQYAINSVPGAGGRKPRQPVRWVAIAGLRDRIPL